MSILKREEKVETFIDYFLFVTFFPQLVAGPIVLYSEMMPQFKDDKRRKIDYDNIALGIYIFVIGLFKKIVIADTLAVFVNNGFGNTSALGLLPAWIISLSYTFQIYFDFSGYSDMAIGIGKMFNIDLPINFNSPYKSKSISEFWKRWHMTLGRALANYIYIPLGGNRKGKTRTYINLFITFLVSGLWHGAAWSFVLWGALHGLFSILDRVFNKFLIKFPPFLKTVWTFLIINFLWVLFRANSMTEAYGIYKGMFNINNLGLNHFASIVNDGIIGFPNAISIIIVAIML
ncbi:MAG TPA: MBOAT family O-acyltransferase, partial [Treponemataceae bacterium]|nr:MBOAT family O-acyltransferase [Treponemataceae bacterium]